MAFRTATRHSDYLEASLDGGVPNFVFPRLDMRGWGGFEVLTTLDGANDARVRLRWLDDHRTGMGAEIDYDDWHCLGANPSIKLVEPTRGPGLEVSITYAATNNSDHTIRVLRTNATLRRMIGPAARPFLLNVHNLSIAAGGALNRTFLYPYAGPAVVWGSSSGTPWSIEFQERTFDGSFQRFASYGSNSVQQPFELYLPPRIIQARLFNSDGATRELSCHVVQTR